MNIKDLLFPPRCPFCDAIIDADIYARRGMCDKCAREVGLRNDPSPLSPEALPHVVEAYAPLIYAGAVKDAITRFKFGGENWICEPLAVILHNYMKQHDGYRYCEAVTNVPISPKRFASRGYDQGELLARRIAELANIPHISCLERPDTAVTSGLNKEQRAEAARRKRYYFKQSELCNVQGRYMLLVDDILTTGSTVNECASLLLSSGAAAVAACAVASGRTDLE